MWCSQNIKKLQCLTLLRFLHFILIVVGWPFFSLFSLYLFYYILNGTTTAIRVWSPIQKIKYNNTTAEMKPTKKEVKIKKCCTKRLYLALGVSNEHVCGERFSSCIFWLCFVSLLISILLSVYIVHAHVSFILHFIFMINHHCFIIVLFLLWFYFIQNQISTDFMIDESHRYI